MKRVRMGKRKSKRWGGVWTVPGFRKHEHRNKLTKTKSEPKAKPTCIVVHNYSRQHSTEQFWLFSLLTCSSHQSSDAVYWRGGGPLTDSFNKLQAFVNVSAGLCLDIIHHHCHYRRHHHHHQHCSRRSELIALIPLLAGLNQAQAHSSTFLHYQTITPLTNYNTSLSNGTRHSDTSLLYISLTLLQSQ